MLDQKALNSRFAKVKIESKTEKVIKNDSKINM